MKDAYQQRVIDHRRKAFTKFAKYYKSSVFSQTGMEPTTLIIDEEQARYYFPYQTVPEISDGLRIKVLTEEQIIEITNRNRW